MWYSAMGQRSKHLPLHRGAYLHDQGRISIIVFYVHPWLSLPALSACFPER